MNGNKCPWRRHCGRQEEPKEETKVQKKEEKKQEQKPKEALNVPKKEEKNMREGASVAETRAKANYVAEALDCDIGKCIMWAERFPFMTRQELLNYCLSEPNFFN